MARDDLILTTMRYISKHQVVQKYGAILPDTLTNQAMKESDAYKTYYAFAYGKEIPKPKYLRPSTREKTVQALKASSGQRLKTTAKVAKSNKKKLPTTVPKAKRLETLSEVALSEDEQMQITTKRSKTQFHSSYASGSGDGADTQSEVPDEQQQKVTGTNKGTGDKLEVPNVPKHDSKSDEESWTFSQDEEDAKEESDINDDSKETDSDCDGDELTHTNLVYTPPDYQLTDEEENQEGDDEVKEGKEGKEEEEVLCGDLNLNLSATTKFFRFIRLGVKVH
nr:hypothetical protein [Tanacetum cinerariifolium]